MRSRSNLALVVGSGLLAMVLTVVFGTLGELVIPGRFIVSGDAAATAANILAHPALFRAGFATYLVEGICDIALCVLFYVLLEPVNRKLALLSAFFGIASMVTFAVAETVAPLSGAVIEVVGACVSPPPAW